MRFLGREFSAERVRENANVKLLIWSIVLVLCIATIVYLITKPGPTPPQLATPPQPASPDTRREQFFDQSVLPAIAVANKVNREAADRCIQRLHDTFGKYREGIGPFTKDLTSWSTRWGIMRRLFNKTALRNFVTGKFEAHLFTKENLKSGIEGSLSNFRKDVEANNNALLTNVRADLSHSDLPNIPTVDYGDFSKDVTASLKEYSTSAAIDNTKNFVLTFVVSGVAGEAAEKILVAIGTRLAATVATTTIAAEGTTAGGAAIGGGGGSTLGPAGAVIGFCAGVAVGVIVDWWMTKRFEARMDRQLNELIDNLESAVIDSSSGQKGIKQSLFETCDVLRDAYRQSFYKRIIKEAAQ